LCSGNGIHAAFLAASRPVVAKDRNLQKKFFLSLCLPGRFLQPSPLPLCLFSGLSTAANQNHWEKMIRALVHERAKFGVKSPSKT
jgi:hypothetical protein